MLGSNLGIYDLRFVNTHDCYKDEQTSLRQDFGPVQESLQGPRHVPVP